MTEDLGWLGEFAIRAAAEAAEGAIGYRVELVEDDEVTLDGTGTPELVLPELPVVAVSSIKLDDVEVDPTTYSVRNSSGVVKRTSGVSWSTWPRPTWRRGSGNVVVVYSHGWSAIGDAEGNQ